MAKVGGRRGSKQKGKQKAEYICPADDLPKEDDDPFRLQRSSTPDSTRSGYAPDTDPFCRGGGLTPPDTPSSGHTQSSSLSSSTSRFPVTQPSSSTMKSMRSPIIKPPPMHTLTDAETKVLCRALTIVMDTLETMFNFMDEMAEVNDVTDERGLPAALRDQKFYRFWYEMIPQTGDRITGVISILEEQAELVGEVLDGPKSIPREVTATVRRGPSRDTAAWVRAIARQVGMSGARSQPASPNASSVSLPASEEPLTRRHIIPQDGTSPHMFRCPIAQLKQRQRRRVRNKYAEVQFRLLRRLHRCSLFDAWTYKRLLRLHRLLEELRVDDGRDGAGPACAMQYATAGMITTIQARLGIVSQDEDEQVNDDGEHFAVEPKPELSETPKKGADGNRSRERIRHRCVHRKGGRGDEKRESTPSLTGTLRRKKNLEQLGQRQRLDDR
ncbi:hypothetical protein B0H63DRAFT_480715 [Podospora didyma]|uniref:Uncharacterized protein n=1 Tax=Podospora didyma TaxID=330526 RepID=A0AAE0N952_9PEZI|nr:hypothetical protein B0H63DRAFT_480715 [Podospora didyma]